MINLDVTNTAIIVAIVQGAKSVFPARVAGIVTLVVAAAVGAALVCYQAEAITTTNVVNGIFAGFVASGVTTVASKIGK